MIRNYEKDGSPRCTRTGDLAFVSPFSSDRVVDVELNAASGSPSYSARYWKEKQKNKIKKFSLLGFRSIAWRLWYPPTFELEDDFSFLYTRVVPRMKRRRVGPDRSGLAVLLCLFFPSLLRSISCLPSISKGVSVQYYHGAKWTDTGYKSLSFWLFWIICVNNSSPLFLSCPQERIDLYYNNQYVWRLVLLSWSWTRLYSVNY